VIVTGCEGDWGNSVPTFLGMLRDSYIPHKAYDLFEIAEIYHNYCIAPLGDSLDDSAMSGVTYQQVV